MIRTGRFLNFAMGCILGVSSSLASGVWAQPARVDSVDDPMHRQYAISLQQYERDAQWRLHGVDGRRGMVFGLRADERVKRLQLDLSYRYSSALLEDLSHLNVVLNGEVVAALPLPRERANDVSKALVELPLEYLQPYNHLELQLIGHYTMECEDPLHSDLWADIDDSSRLLFDVAYTVLPDDLSVLPAPFFDPRDVRSLEIPFVLGEPTDERLEAAGIVASWLGTLAGYRGIRFTADAQSIPERGHAIIVLGPSEILDGVELPAVQGPTVAIRTNPNDSGGKLLVIAGRNDDEIRIAAVSLALGTQVLSGPEATVTLVQEQARQPYDAPNWLPTNRPVALGELLSKRDFTVVGYDPSPINIGGLYLPPDLSDWRTKSVPLQLLYRHSAVNEGEGGTLDILANQQVVESIRLADTEELAKRMVAHDGSVQSETVQLPVATLGSLASLQFQFRYPAPSDRECSGGFIDVRQSAIDPASTLDLSGLPHHKAMPDLAAFGTSGFPFTRMADLSDTAVLLRAGAGGHEFSAFLSILGRMGQLTGYPATRVTVARDGAGLNDKDLLLLDVGSGSNIASQWFRYVPGMRQARASSDEAGGTVPNSLMGGTYLAGFESPLASSRSVVLVAGADGASLQSAIELMITDAVQRSQLQGSLALVSDGRIKSLSNEKTYYVGSLGARQTLIWFLSTRPFLLFMLCLVSAVFIAMILYWSLRARAHRRLLSGYSETQ